MRECVSQTNFKITTKIHCIGTRHGKQWPVDGANIEICSNFFCIHQNLTWIDFSHTFMIWEGLWTQRWLTHPILYIFDLVLVSFELSQIVMHGTQPNMHIHVMVFANLYIHCTSFKTSIMPIRPMRFVARRSH